MEGPLGQDLHDGDPEHMQRPEGPRRVGHRLKKKRELLRAKGTVQIPIGAGGRGAEERAGAEKEVGVEDRKAGEKQERCVGHRLRDRGKVKRGRWGEDTVVNGEGGDGLFKSVRPSVCPYVFMSLYLRGYVSVRLSVCPSVFLFCQSEVLGKSLGEFVFAFCYSF